MAGNRDRRKGRAPKTRTAQSGDYDPHAGAQIAKFYGIQRTDAQGRTPVKRQGTIIGWLKRREPMEPAQPARPANAAPSWTMGTRPGGRP